jgi:predicted transcriptional regulator
MNNEELDTIFSVLENPIRRKILAKLAKEQHYPLQLSKELNISQQAIMKHLKVLEDNNLVASFEEKSTLGGPPRKSYVSNKHITLRIDVGPSTYKADIYDYKEMEIKNEIDQHVKKEIDKYDDFVRDYQKSRGIKEPGKRLNELSQIIQKVDRELQDLKVKRAKLMNIREHII